METANTTPSPLSHVRQDCLGQEVFIRTFLLVRVPRSFSDILPYFASTYYDIDGKGLHVPTKLLIQIYSNTASNNTIRVSSI